MQRRPNANGFLTRDTRLAHERQTWRSGGWAEPSPVKFDNRENMSVPFVFAVN